MKNKRSLAADFKRTEKILELPVTSALRLNKILPQKLIMRGTIWQRTMLLNLRV